MKKLVIGIIASAAIILSCSKAALPELSSTSSLTVYDTEQMSDIVDDFTSTGPNWRDRWRKFVRSHWGKADEQYLQTGIKNPNCQGEGDCGPCPSLCLRISLGLNGNDGTTTELTQSEINTGYGLFELAIIEDTTTNSETVMISVKDDFFNSYILNDYFTIPEEHQVDESIAEALGCSSITLYPGLYKVQYNNNKAHTVLLNADIE